MIDAASETTRNDAAGMIEALRTAVCQQGATVPAGFTFDPRGNPPLFPTPAPAVASELRNEADETLTPGCEHCAGACTGACDPAGDEPGGSAP